MARNTCLDPNVDQILTTTISNDATSGFNGCRLSFLMLPFFHLNIVTLCSSFDHVLSSLLNILNHNTSLSYISLLEFPKSFMDILWSQNTPETLPNFNHLALIL